MYSLLLALIYLAFISLGLPDSLLGSAWPNIQSTVQVPTSYGGILSFLITASTILSSLGSGRMMRRFGTGGTACHRHHCPRAGRGKNPEKGRCY